MLPLKTIFRNLLHLKTNADISLKELRELKLLMGAELSRKSAEAKSLNEAEFKVFSQWGDDGIIQYLIQNIEIENKYFVEFGVENYTEANTRFLLMNNNWSGLVMDGSAENVRFIHQDEIYWRYDLKARAAFITAENINTLLEEEKVADNIGILHIDIDGNDYWVWKKIKMNADIVIVEYNSLFGKDRAITIPYQADFIRSKAHYSNLYYGTSLSSIVDLAEEKNYAFVGCNSAGNNAYFVKKNKLGKIKRLSIEEGFVEAKFRESRNEKGELTFLNIEKKRELIKGLPAVNTRSNKTESI